MARLLIVSNRLPVTVSVVDGAVSVKESTGGLATGLRGPHEQSGGLWFGWPGDLGGLDSQQRSALDARLRDLRVVPIEIAPAEFDGFYKAVSNGVLWPLFHSLVDRLPYRHDEWRSYAAVNARFAEIIAEQWREGDLIWVHDYQLALLPGLLRERLPTAKIGFFLHIPFPPAEVFRLLPQRELVLRGMLGADVVGFHTYAYVRGFSSALTQTLGKLPVADRVVVEGRDVRLGVYPMGVDALSFDAISREPQTAVEAAKLRGELAGGHLLLGIDRLDYTKGLPRRMLAIERLLERNEGLRGRLRFVQIAVPSRVDVSQYEAFAGEVQQLVGRINGRFSTASSVPIHFLHQGFSQRELVGLFRAADVMLVTPLRDGMNLVAKEFVASRADEGGVLVLSEFAGAASEFGEAVLVNPYDIERTADAIERALAMKPEAVHARMRALRERVFAYDVHRWAREFLDHLEASGTQGEPTSPRRPRPPADAGTRLAAARETLWLLDYDGTLVPYADRPEFAEPDGEILELLGGLAATPGAHVHIVSGRSREALDAWLGALPLGMHAEHGVWSKDPGGTWRPNLAIDDAWKVLVRPPLHDFAARTPGALVEEKSASLAFHYRMADVEYGERQARELQIHLSQVLSNVPVEVLAGNRVIEVKAHGVNKGVIATRLLERFPAAVVVAVGDDETDEFMFRALPESALSICVGTRATGARFWLPNVRAVRGLLRQVLTRRSGTTR